MGERVGLGKQMQTLEAVSENVMRVMLVLGCLFAVLNAQAAGLQEWRNSN